MVNFRTVKRNGKSRIIPVSSHRKIERTVNLNEIQADRRMGIRHPGSMTSLGYHMRDPTEERDQALDRIVKKYGEKETLLKLGEIRMLDAHKPELRRIAEIDIRYVQSKGKTKEE